MSSQNTRKMSFLKSALRSTAAARQCRRTVAAMPKSVVQHQMASASVLTPTANDGFGRSGAALACGISLCAAAAYEVDPRKAECEMMLSPVTEPATGILFPKLCNGLCL